jgi:Protein of unknown function (DUF1552)
MPSSWLLPRRTFLKSASACIALPFLDAMVPANPARGRGTGKPPVRLAWLYIPNGVVIEKWRPAQVGAGYELSELLKPLAPVKDRVLVLSDFTGLHNQGLGGSHESSGGSMLVGQLCKHSQQAESAGPSIDQVAARMIGDQTPIDTLTLGIDPGHEGDHGYSGTYLSHMSWRNPTTPAAVEMDPKELFDRLFQGRPVKPPSWNKAEKPTTAKPKAVKVDSEQRIGTSILDLVREDARKLMGNLGSNDRTKMEGYLDGIRNIERRLDLAEKDSAEAAAAGPASKEKPGASKNGAPPELMIPTKAGRPPVYADHVNLMLDLMVMALWTDKTRLATFMFSFEKSNRAYPELGVSGAHHSLSHHSGVQENIDALTKIHLHHMTLFSRMLSNMSKLKDGDGTLLDNVAIMYGSGMGDSNSHNHHSIPILLAGGGGGAIKGGSHIAFGKEVPVCNLYLDMMAMAGLEMEKFGDSTGRLTFK